MSHAKGPWSSHLEYYGSKVNFPEINIRALSGSFVCTAAEQNEGNAHLIAAAPELLEALEFLFHQPSLVLPPEQNERFLNLIKKARGEL